MNLRRAVLTGLTAVGLAALIIVPLVRPDRAGTPRDAVGRAMQDLLAIEPGMIRDAVDKHAVAVFRRPDGVEVFRHPRSEFLRIDLRFSGSKGTDRLLAVGDPYLAPYPTPNHLP